MYEHDDIISYPEYTHSVSTLTANQSLILIPHDDSAPVFRRFELGSASGSASLVSLSSFSSFDSAGRFSTPDVACFVEPDCSNLGWGTLDFFFTRPLREGLASFLRIFGAAVGAGGGVGAVGAVFIRAATALEKYEARIRPL